LPSLFRPSGADNTRTILKSSVSGDSRARTSPQGSKYFERTAALGRAHDSATSVRPRSKAVPHSAWPSRLICSQNTRLRGRSNRLWSLFFDRHGFEKGSRRSRNGRCSIREA